MAEIQYITKDWAEKIEAHIETMAAANEAATSAGPSDEHSRLWDIYAGTCHDFLDHIRNFYGSPQGFSDFLRKEVEHKFLEAGLTADQIDGYPCWRIYDNQEWATASGLSTLYRFGYLEFMEAAANKKAFHHAAPLEFNL